MVKVMLISCAVICAFFTLCYCLVEDNNLFEYDYVSNLDDGCMNCICQGITDCDQELTCTEVPGYCGPYKLNKAYWLDTGKILNNPNDDPNRNNAYEDCALHIECARLMVRNYMIKHGRDCNGDGVTDCSDFMMLHYNGNASCYQTLESAPMNPEVLERFNTCWDLEKYAKYDI